MPNVRGGACSTSRPDAGHHLQDTLGVIFSVESDFRVENSINSNFRHPGAQTSEIRPQNIEHPSIVLIIFNCFGRRKASAD